MQIIAEILMAAAVWIAAVVLAQFGVQVDLSRDAVPTVERVAERDPSGGPMTPTSTACPDAARAPARASHHAV